MRNETTDPSARRAALKAKLDLLGREAGHLAELMRAVIDAKSRDEALRAYHAFEAACEETQDALVPKSDAFRRARKGAGPRQYPD